MNKEIKKEDLWCEYSDLPSPRGYMSCTDYDSMGNHGRFPKIVKKESFMGKLRKFTSKIIKK